MKVMCIIVVIVVVVILLMSVFFVFVEVSLIGVGVIFFVLVYVKWVDIYQKEIGNKVNYQGIGFFGGVKQIIVNIVDFGVFDVLLFDEKLVQEGLFQFLIVIGGVVLVVNILGLKFGELVLDGKIFGDIYLGKIKKWDDEVIVKLNLGLKLFLQNIVVVCCVDGFGIFFVFISYLVKVNEEWKNNVGIGFIVKWLIGLGGKGNDGIVVFVQCLLGVIGYVEYVYVKQNNLVYIKLIFVDGKLVSLIEENFVNVVKGVDWSKIFVQDLINQKGEDVWFIIFIMFILIYKDQKKLE